MKDNIREGKGVSGGGDFTGVISSQNIRSGNKVVFSPSWMNETSHPVLPLKTYRQDVMWISVRP